MAKELEAKFKVADFNAVRKALREAGGVYRGTCEHTDTFFDSPGRKLLRADCGLRLRRIRILRKAPGQGKAGWLLTYKGPRARGRRLKVRNEIQTSVSDGEALAEILHAAGLRELLKLQKRRTSYLLGRCLVELDEVPVLGRFVEIEAPSAAALQAARRKLNLPDEPITETYAHMADQCG